MAVQLSTRAAEMRSAMERAWGSVATVTAIGQRVRISVPYSVAWPIEQFRRVLYLVQSAPNWGSTSHPEHVLWAEYGQGDDAWH
jgi:hypothetical protein